MLSVQNFTTGHSNLTFKANNNQPCETHATLKTSAIFATTALTSELLGYHYLKSKVTGQNAEQLFKSMAKFSLATLPIVIVGFLTCAFGVDNLINKKHKKLADDIKTKNKQEILTNDKNIKTTEKGNLYYHSNTGKKVYSAYNSAISVIAGTIASVVFKTPKTYISNAISGAIGGLVFGTVSDYFANRTAEKFADKQAEKTTK